MRCAPICPASDRIFCPDCGRVLDRAGLRQVRIMGGVGVVNGSSDSLDKFWATGDPDVFG